MSTGRGKRRQNLVYCRSQCREHPVSRTHRRTDSGSMTHPGATRNVLAVVFFLFSAATARSWNNPYPASEAEANILYSAFCERPKTFDPARAYSSNEYLFIAQIYEPPFQYHYLKRPY